MKKSVLLFTATLLLHITRAQTSISISLNKTDFCIGDSLVATISFSRPPNVYYTGFYGITGTIISGYAEYSQYHTSNQKNGTLVVSKTYLTTNDSIFKITVGDSMTSSTSEVKYTKPYKVHERPVARFREINGKNQCENRGIQFNLYSFSDSSTASPGGYIAQRLWYFGDGNNLPGNSPSPSHSYNYNTGGDSLNMYTVSLKVTDNFGCTDSTAESGFWVHPVPVPKPTVSGPLTQCLVGNLFTFIDSSFFVATTTETLHTVWRFSPTDSSFSKTASHHFSLAGTQRAALVTYTDYGCGDTSSVFVTVKPGPEPLSISGNQNVISGTAHTYSVLNTSGSTYNWSVTNGSITSGNGTNNISVTWAAMGTGKVNLVETNTEGCMSDTSSLMVQINPNGIATPHQLATLAYPNPVNTWLTVRNPEQQQGKVTLYRMDGKEVWSTELKPGEVLRADMQMLVPGSYYIQLTTVQTSYSQRLLVLR